MSDGYTCAACGVAVIVIDGAIIRPCPHTDSGVIAQRSAKLKGVTSINKEENTKDEEHGRIPKHE